MKKKTKAETEKNKKMIRDIKNHLWATEGRLVTAVYNLADLQLRSKDVKPLIVDKDGNHEPTPWEAAIGYLAIIVTRLQSEMNVNVQMLTELQKGVQDDDTKPLQSKAGE